MKFNIVVLIAVINLMGCSPQIKTTEKIELSTAAPIINGTLVTANDKIAAQVVLVHDIKNDYVCTGTLIAKNTVLTAAHCLSRKHQQYEIIFSRSGYKTLDAHVTSQIRKATKVVVHENFEFDENKAPESNQADIGLIYFEGSLPSGYTIANVAMDEQLLKAGQSVTLAGFGTSKLSYAEIKYKLSQKFKDKIKNGEVICNHNSYDTDGDPVCVDITRVDDGELRKTQTQIKYTSATEFTLDETKAGTCSGDSGGPVFVEQDQQLYLVGLTSRGDFLCDSDGVYTSIPSYIDWLLTH